MLLLIAPLVAGCWGQDSGSAKSAAPGADPVIARVNGVAITQGDLALAEEDVGADMQGASPEAKREQLIGYLTDIILVTQAADKKNLGDSPDFKRRLAFLRNKLLMGFGLQEETKAALTDEAMQQTYDEAVKSNGGAGGGARPPHPGGDRGRGQGDRRADQGRRRFRHAGQGEVEGSRRRRRRRSRLFHQGPDGAASSPRWRSRCIRASSRTR